MRTFVESRIFSKKRCEFLSDDSYRKLQNELMANPKEGKVMRGCGGLRKIRVEDPSRGKGKRSGARAIYLDIPDADRIDMIAIYGKDEQEDLTSEQRKLLAKVAFQAKAEALASINKGGR